MVNMRMISRGEEGFLEPADSPGSHCVELSDESPLTDPQSKHDYFTCTRILGHEGDHAAHGISDTQYATWD